MFGTRFGHMTKIKFFPSHLSGTIGSNNRTTDHTHFLPTMISLMTEKYIYSVLLHVLYYVCSFLFFQVCALWTKAYCQYLGVKHARLHLIKRTCKYIFCYFRMTVVVKEWAKTIHVMKNYWALVKTSNNSYCFRSNE